MKKVLLYLDTNKVANPFDLFISLDAGYDAVLPYANISDENVEYIIHNTIFAREREGLDNTVILVGGGLEESERVFQKLRRMLRDPFRMSVIWDPNGACTTAAATVAKIEKLSGGSGGLKGKRITLLAGTGPIGQISALLLRNLGAEVTITSRNPDKGQKISRGLSDGVRGMVRAVRGSNITERCDACKDSEIILSTGAIGVQLLDSEALGGLSPKIIADVNAVQPYGIESMKPDYDGDVVGGVKMLGSFSIGDLKNLVEIEMLKQAIGGNKFYDYNDALIVARDLLR